MSYSPAQRGPFPVGVRSVKLVDGRRRARVLWSEIWYPAADSHRGQDLARATADKYVLWPGMPGLAAARQQAVRDAEPRSGECPLVVFSHGFGSHRRQSSFLCTHLASHGYVVAAPDHLGNTMRDVGQLIVMAAGAGRVPRLYESLPQVAEARPADVSAVVDSLLLEPPEGVASIDGASSVGIAGHSFGGWTALVAAGRDHRVGAALAMAPAGGKSTIPGRALQTVVARDCRRSVSTLLVAAERDSLLPLSGVRELGALLVDPKRLLVLERADHMHFVDYPQATHEMLRRMLAKPAAAGLGDMLLSAPLTPFAELAAEEPALAAVRAVGLAHIDAELRGLSRAAEWLSGALAPGLRADSPL